MRYLQFETNIKINGYEDLERNMIFLRKKYPNEIALHNHLPDQKHYSYYPLVQPKIINNKLGFLGFKEDGERILCKIFIDKIFGDNCFINNKYYDVCVAKSRKYIYEVKTPLLLLKSDNLKIYNKLKSGLQKRSFLDRILIGNIFHFLKNNEIFINDEIQVENFLFQNKKEKIKNIDYLIFEGVFRTNIFLPEYISFGKFKSKGYGIFKKI